jgi:heme/copper-type cytochrome/quinol oxidase subunit 2
MLSGRPKTVTVQFFDTWETAAAKANTIHSTNWKLIIIIAGAVGGFLLVIVVAVVLYFLLRKKPSKKDDGSHKKSSTDDFINSIIAENKIKPEGGSNKKA